MNCQQLGIRNVEMWYNFHIILLCTFLDRSHIWLKLTGLGDSITPFWALSRSKEQNTTPQRNAVPGYSPNITKTDRSGSTKYELMVTEKLTGNVKSVTYPNVRHTLRRRVRNRANADGSQVYNHVRTCRLLNLFNDAISNYICLFTLEQASRIAKDSSTLSLALVLDGVDCQGHAPAALPPGKRPHTHCTGGWMGPRGRSGWVQNVSFPRGFDPRTVQLVASRYTDWAIPAHFPVTYLV